MKSHSSLWRAGRYLALAAASTLLLSGCGSQYVVLNPVGPVGQRELQLIELSVALILIVIIPVILLLVFIVYRYRDRPDNRAPYMPNWSDSRVLEMIWWGIPIVIVGILGAATVKTTYAVSRPPEKGAQPMTVEVTSLDWKWLFQYPGQKIATVNYAVIPAGVPVQFVLTADAPMNSFWVPQLGGQEYAMPGMAQRLWLQADRPGDYYGHGANFTGRGFAQNAFRVIAKPASQFDAWVRGVKATAPVLTKAGYAKLVRPGLVQPLSFSGYPAGTFLHTVMKNGGKYMPATMGVMDSIHAPSAMHN